MRFIDLLSRLRRRPVGAHYWPDIASKISHVFEPIRSESFSEAVDFLKETSEVTREQTDGKLLIPMKTGRLWGRAVYAMTGYQWGCANAVLQQKGYVRKRDLLHFEMVLWEKCFSSQEERNQALVFYDCYMSAGAQAMEGLAMDLAVHICGGPIPPLQATIAMMPAVKFLHVASFGAVAAGFGDDRGGAKLVRGFTVG